MLAFELTPGPLFLQPMQPPGRHHRPPPAVPLSGITTYLSNSPNKNSIVCPVVWVIRCYLINIIFLVWVNCSRWF